MGGEQQQQPGSGSRPVTAALIRVGSSVPGADGMGSEVELVRIRNTQLFLIDGEESVLMQSGDFVLVLQKQHRTPLAAVVAMVGDVEWPVGKDAPVLRIADGRYAFALPGFVYGVVLPDAVPADAVRLLEHVLDLYSTFEAKPDLQLPGIDAQGRSGLQQDSAQFWTAAASEVERSSLKLARQISSGSATAANSIVKSAEWAAMGIQKGGALIKSHSTARLAGQGAEISPRMLKRVQQARRLSAVAKLFSKTLMKGAISATGHVANTIGSVINATAPGRAFQESAMRDVAVAGVDAFGKVVEAVECAGRALLETSSSVGTDLVQHKYGEQAVPLAEEGFGAVGNVINTAWTLNKMGLHMLLRTLAASTAANVVQGPGKPASSSSTGSEASRFMSPASQSSGPAHASSPAMSDQSTGAQRPIRIPATPASPPLQTTQFFPVRPGVGTALPAVIDDGAATFISPSVNSPFQEYTRVAQPQAQSHSMFNFPWNARLQGQ